MAAPDQPPTEDSPGSLSPAELPATLGPPPVQEFPSTYVAGRHEPETAGDEPAGPNPSVGVAGYEVLAELGRGGMGVVYKARQIGLNRIVALKMILAGSHASPEDRQRFRAEAAAVARLRHPNIIQVHEIGEQNGLPYFSLEFCDSGS